MIYLFTTGPIHVVNLGYLLVIKSEVGAIKEKMATHLEELMSDAELYSWERVRAHHRVWLNQLEQGHVGGAR